MSNRKVRSNIVTMEQKVGYIRAEFCEKSPNVPAKYFQQWFKEDFCQFAEQIDK